MAHRGSPGIHAGRPTPQNLHSASRRALDQNPAEAADRPACVVVLRAGFKAFEPLQIFGIFRTGLPIAVAVAPRL